jgi:hypothetical protein
VSVHDIGEQPQAIGDRKRNASGSSRDPVPHPASSSTGPPLASTSGTIRAATSSMVAGSPGRRRRGIRSSHNQSPERPFSLLMLLDLLTGKLDDAARRTNQQLT